MTKALAVEVVSRSKNRKKIAKQIKGAAVRVKIHEKPEIPYKCTECGYWHVSGVRQIDKAKHWDRTRTKKPK